MTKELYEDLSEEELDKFEKVKDFEIDENSLKISDGICLGCNEKMDKVIENLNLFDGALTFHLIKYRCSRCKKEYMDLEQAEKYDLYSSLKRLRKPISYITNSLTRKQEFTA